MTVAVPASMATNSGFQLLVRDGPTRELVGDLPRLDRRTVVLVHPEDRSVVVGSTQKVTGDERLAWESAGLVVNRRRSGGAAVVIDPRESIWIDFFLPSSDPLFDRDVRLGAHWVGEIWAEALAVLGEPAARGEVIAVHRGGLITGTWSDRCCFAGLGPGEVVLGRRKVVGLSQRRDRAGAWFFSLAYRSYDPNRDARLLAPSELAIGPMAESLNGIVAVIDHPLVEVERAVLGALARVHS